MKVKETFTLKLSERFVFNKEIEFELPKISSVELNDGLDKGSKILTLEFLFKDSCMFFDFINDISKERNAIVDFEPPEILDLVPHLKKLTGILLPIEFFLPDVVVGCESVTINAKRREAYFSFHVRSNTKIFLTEEFLSALKEMGLPSP